jgi:ATP-dependent DNA helicase RecQ
VRQLVALGKLGTDPAGHGSLIVTEQARALLRGEERFEVRRTPDAPVKRAARARSAVLAPEHEGLFGKLRALRLSLARELGVPPYVIFHDATLKQMAELRPKSMAELGGISGVGKAKLERFGERFLAEINDG